MNKKILIVGITFTITVLILELIAKSQESYEDPPELDGVSPVQRLKDLQVLFEML